MQWNATHTRLNRLLARLIPFKKDAYQIAVKAVLNVDLIAFDDKAKVNWFGIIQQAIFENKVEQLVQILIDEYGPLKPLIAFQQNQLDSVALDGGDTDQLDWRVNEEGNLSDFNYERIIGKESSLLPIHYLEKGMELAKSVAKIWTPEGSGTGFLTKNNILITNNHVLPSKKMCEKSHVVFNYQKNAQGLEMESTSFDFDPDSTFKTNRKNDWTAVRLSGDANESWGAISTAGRSGLKVNDRVVIIQHPGGMHKQIAFHHNYVRYFDETIIQYLTDTLPGSSGSPVFDLDWNLVAIHQAGGYLHDPKSKRLVFRNQGIMIQQIQF